MRIAIVTSAHRWSDPRVFEREARSLAQAGHQVTLVAPGAPHGHYDGVHVTGPQPPASRVRRMTTTMRALVRHVPPDADAIHIHDPELLLWFAWRRVRRRDEYLVYDVHEQYSAQLSEKPWIPRRLRKVAAVALGRLERRVASHCDLIVAATPSIAEQFPAERTVVVENVPINDHLPPIEALGALHGAGRSTTVVHLGELNERRGANELLEALEYTRSPVEVHQVGLVKPTSLLDAAPASVVHVPPVEHSEALQHLANADTAIVLFHPGPNHDHSQPNKLFEYFACGVPIIASDFAHWRELAARAGANVTFVDPHAPRAIAAALDAIRPPDPVSQRDRARRARQTFSWERQEPVLMDAYAALAGDSN